MSDYRRALETWDAYRKSFKVRAIVDRQESDPDKAARKKRLEANRNEWFQYYFSKYASKPFAKFHDRFGRKVEDNPVIYITRRWARDHAKTTYCQMLLTRLVLMKKNKCWLIVSKSKDAAEEILGVIKKELEENPRILADYGRQVGPIWTSNKIVLRNGASFRAIGKGQSPRGAKNDEARPDGILVDDADDDIGVQNPDTLDEEFEWLQGALFGCFDISGLTKRFIVVNNVIAPDCLVNRAAANADDDEIINILNEDGTPSWHPLEDCQYMIKKMGYFLSQREYFNNPIKKGKVFKPEWIQYKKMPSLNAYQYLVTYLDPSFSDKKHADNKALHLIGYLDGEYHIHKVYCDVASIKEMIGWHYELSRWCNANKGTPVWWMEDVFFQSLLYKDFNAAVQEYGFPIPVRGDKRDKPNKDLRIGAMSGYFERGNVFFSDKLKENHHMQNLESQLLGFDMGSNKVKKDGPDALEGGIFKLNEMVFTQSYKPTFGKNRSGDKRL